MSRISYIRITLFFEQEKDGRWTAKCKELGTSTFGRSLEDAKACLEEAIELHLNTLEDVGERERFFAEHGIKLLHTKPRLKTTYIEAPINPHVLINTHFQSIHAVSA